MRRALSSLAIVLMPLVSSAQAAETGERRILEGGWFDLAPYSYVDEEGTPTGFDVALLREVARRADIGLAFRQIDWHRTQALVRSGQLDFGLAAYRNPERQVYAAFSRPYRRESDRLFVAPRIAARIMARTPDALFAEVRRLGLKIGVVGGYHYGPHGSAFLSDPASQPLIVTSRTDRENVGRMAAGEINGFLADRLSGYHALAASAGTTIAVPVPVSVFD